MLTALKLHHFKAFEEAAIPLTWLNIFVGPNNSGKSSILAAPRLLAQTVLGYDTSIPLLLSGEFGDFGTYRDLVFRNDIRHHFSLSFTVSPLRRLSSARSRPGERATLSLNFGFREGRKEIILSHAEAEVDEMPVLRTIFSKSADRHLIRGLNDRELPVSQRSSASRALDFRYFIPNIFRLGSRRGSGKISDEEFVRAGDLMNQAAYGIVRTFQNVEYVGAMRVPPLRTYIYPGGYRQRVGATGENAISIIAMDALRVGRKSKRIIDSVKSWLAQAEIASNLQISPVSDRQYEVMIQHPLTKESSNFADVGYSMSQIIPVLVGGFNLSQGSIYIVEEPEIHLHPRAQAELGDFFVSLSNSGIQSFVETHSEHLILRIQQHVASGKLKPTDVNFFYVYAVEGKKQVVQLTLDENARFREEWPGGFFPERLEESVRLAKIRSGIEI